MAVSIDNAMDLVSTRSGGDASFLERKIRSLTIRRSTTAVVAPDRIGPLGLNLLCSPPEVVADLIFVHGLRGGSMKTWSATADPVHYWPREWLPGDSDFQHVRIWSYGYDSDFTRTDSTMDVHEVGQALALELHSALDQDTDIPIVLVGHSLGGLVIKKVCIITKEDPNLRDLGSRIHSIFFLAVPHRGSDLATTLSNILRVSIPGMHGLVGNLQRGSEAIRLLNEQFRHHYKGIHLHSFIESATMSWGTGRGLVVDRESATLGLPEERIQMIDADHRSICIFQDPSDANYRTLRNRLAATVRDIQKATSTNKHQMHRKVMKDLAKYLGVDSNLEDLLEKAEERQEGSCEWLVNRETFQNWQYVDESPRYFWLIGKPATGKSVLATYVISNLKGAPCSYFFFKQGDFERSRLSSFMRSIAYQMAALNRTIRDALVKISEDEPNLPKENHRIIWQKIFLNGIFNIKFHHTHYWVIDALDECNTGVKSDSSSLFSMLSKIDASARLKIFMSSRPSEDLERHFRPFPIVREEIGLQDSLHDIHLYVEAKSGGLPVEDEDTRKALVQKILEKSNGCFLWTNLVLNQLQSVYSLEETQEVLEEVPPEMEPLYYRNLEVMVKNKRTARLAKTILKWVICAVRPLTIDELKAAIKLDINDTVSRDLERSLPFLCGQLVSVDRSGGTSRIQLVHQTARAFLTNPNLDSEYRIHTPTGHLDLAIACITYLTSDEMKLYPRRRGSSSAGQSLHVSPLADYACINLSKHITRAQSSNPHLPKAMHRFFTSNVLSWIERIAQSGDLSPLIDGARNLKSYLNRRAKHSPLLENDTAQWAEDIPRIVTEFGNNLLKYPHCIHELIAPFCPMNSAIRTLSKRISRGVAQSPISVIGISYPEWPDRISRINYRHVKPKSMDSRNELLAIGLSDGRINLYSSSTFQPIRVLHHGETVRIVRFCESLRLLATASVFAVKVWDVGTGSLLQAVKLDSNPLDLAFAEGDAFLTIALQSKEILQYRIDEGVIAYHDRWNDILPDGAGNTRGLMPSSVVISAEQQLMAIITRNKPIGLWCLDTHQYLGSCSRTSEKGENDAQGVTSAVFQPDPTLAQLAVAHWDGELVLFDIDCRQQLATVQSEVDTLAVSPNGKTLIGGNVNGKIQLFDFETLHLIYQINESAEPIVSLKFTGDGLRFVDIRGNGANVWEVAALIRKEIGDSGSEPSDIPMEEATEVDIRLIEDELVINTFICSEDGKTAISGRRSGQISLHDLENPEQRPRRLYKHKGSSFLEIINIDWNENAQLVASVDTSGSYQVVRLGRDNSNQIIATAIVLKGRIEAAYHSVNHSILSPDGTRYLLATVNGDFLWNLKTKKLAYSRTVPNRRSWNWFKHPTDSSQLVLQQETHLQLYDWESLQACSEIAELDIGHARAEEFTATEVALSTNSGHVAIREVRERVDATLKTKRISRSTHLIILPPFSSITELQASSTPLFAFQGGSPSAAPEIESLLGVFKGPFESNFLVFLSEDGWICSLEMDLSAPQGTYRRHFFLPNVWLSSGEQLVARVTVQKDIVFVRGHELAIVRNGLDRIENVDFKRME